jgi:hypothetical protein
MARTINIPLNTYQPGNYGPFTVNGFNSNNTDYILLTMTVDGTWPLTQDILFKLDMLFGESGGASYEVVGDQRDKFGVLKPTVEFKVPFPNDVNGKQNRTNLSATAQVFAAFDTAITLQAV